MSSRAHFGLVFPRISSLILALAGCFWALMLLGVTGKILQYSAQGLIWLLWWLPGFIAWYGYIRHVLGHYIFRQARFTWMLSLLANSWSLLLIRGRPGLGLVWLVFALILSLICLILEWNRREAEPNVPTHVTNEEFKKLLDEHRKAR